MEREGVDLNVSAILAPWATLGTGKTGDRPGRPRGAKAAPWDTRVSPQFCGGAKAAPWDTRVSPQFCGVAATGQEAYPTGWADFFI